MANQETHFQHVDVKESMQTLAKERFTFVSHNTPHRDDPTREVRISAIRSHATRVLYARRNVKVKSASKPTVLLPLRAKPTTKCSGNEGPSSTDNVPATQTSQPSPYQLVSRPSHRRQSKPESSHSRHALSIKTKNGHRPYVAANKPDYSDKDTSLSHATHQTVIATTSIYTEGFLGIRVDPFNCVRQAASDRGVAFIIDWYNQNSSPSSDVACYVYNVTNGYATHFLSTLTDDAFFHAGMAVIQFMYEQVQHPGSPPSVQVLRYRGLAMAKVRQRLTDSLSDPVEDLTMYSIIFLCLLDGAMGNLAAHKVHKRSLSAILANRGGLDSLPDGSLMKASLLQFDTSWTLETGESVAHRRRSTVKCEENPEWTKFCLETLPQPLQDLYRASGLPHSQLQILHRACKLSKLSYRDRMELLSSSRRSTSRYNDFREADPCLDFSDDQFSELGKIFSLSLIIYCYTAFGLRSLSNAQRVGRTELTRRIQLYKPTSKVEEDGVIWMWLLAINAWATNDILQPQGLSLMAELQSRNVRCTNLPHVIEIGNNFLWTPDLTKSMERLWLRNSASVGVPAREERFQRIG